ncbi:DUF3568 family protein [Candidatus Omnitrophota bacterium]
MLRRILYILLIAVMMPVLSGCIALLAGAGGTTLWQAGKVISEENISMERGILATEAAFKAKHIILTEKVTKNEVAQLRGEDLSDKRVAVDVFSKGPKNVRIEIRYGIGDETAAREILNEIKRRL